VLTPAGQRLRDTSTSAFTQLRDTCDELRAGKVHAPFVLGCPVSLLARWMIPRLERLMGELPELDLHLRPQETAFDESLLGLDAAIMAGDPPWPTGWRVYPLANERIGPVASPEFVKAHRLTRNRPQALLEQTLLHTQSRPDAWGHWSDAAGLPAKKLRLGQGYPHLYHMIEAAVAGRGVAIAPAQLVADDLASGRLAAPWGFQEVRAQWILATSTRVSDPRVEGLAEWLRNAFAEHTH
jgi:DNA-binding transcriptional LysR family regulator